MNKMAVQLAEDVKGLGTRGQVITLALTPSDVNIQEELDTFMAGYSPMGFRADEVSEPWLVDKDSDKYRVFGSNNAFRQVNVESSIQAGVKQVDPETSLQDYRVIERALGSFIPAAVEGQSSFDLRAASSRRIQWALGLDREVRVWGKLTTTAEWDASCVETLTFGWNDTANSDPIADLQERIEASAQLITDIWMSPLSAHPFIRHPSVRDHMRQMLGDSAPSAQAIASAAVQQSVDFQIPGFPPFHVVPGKVLNESSGLLDYILADDVVLTVSPRGVPTTGEEIKTVQTFRRRGPSGTGFTSREFFVQDRGLDGGSMLVAGHAEDVRFVGTNVGGLIKNTRT